MSEMSDAGWLHEFPSREAVEAHIAAHPPLSSAPPWATGAPWLRHHGDVTVIYLAVRDGVVRARFPNGADWHTLEFGRFGWWRPITAYGDPAPVGGVREERAMLREIRRECIASVRGEEHAAALTDEEIDAHLPSTPVDVSNLAARAQIAEAQLRGAKATIAELLRAGDEEKATREARWSTHLADVERLMAERDAARAIIAGRGSQP